MENSKKGKDSAFPRYWQRGITKTEYLAALLYATQRKTFTPQRAIQEAGEFWRSLEEIEAKAKNKT